MKRGEVLSELHFVAFVFLFPCQTGCMKAMEKYLFREVLILNVSSK